MLPESTRRRLTRASTLSCCIRFSTRGFGSVNFTYPSAYGVIRSEWKVQDGTATWHITIPANATGWLSAAEKSASHLKAAPQNNGSMKPAAGPHGESGVRLDSGTYEFTAEIK